jgi:exosortase
MLPATTLHSRSLAISAIPLFGLLGWAYLPTLQWMADKWASDPQYSHGFLVPLFSAYLLYRNRETPGPWRSAPLPIVGGALLVIALVMRAVSGGLLFHQLDAASLLVTLLGMSAALGGRQLLRRTAPAILFLIFMFPLPFELERDVGGPLKTVATYSSTFLLQTCGLPAIAEGNVILIDEIKLGVVDACSGLKMLMTFAAFSAGAVLLAQRTMFEKLMVLLGIVPIALLANVLRITATGISLTFGPDKQTTEFLHDFYGWLMMPVGLVLLGLELWILKRLVVQPNN